MDTVKEIGKYLGTNEMKHAFNMFVSNPTL